MLTRKLEPSGAVGAAVKRPGWLIRYPATSPPTMPTTKKPKMFTTFTHLPPPGQLLQSLCVWLYWNASTSKTLIGTIRGLKRPHASDGAQLFSTRLVVVLNVALGSLLTKESRS